MKAIILKPIVWNSKNYTKPSGHKASSGFAKDYGYGHEEWNNSKNNIWRNQRVFHTEHSKKLLDYSKNGELGIIPIASFDSVQYALGIATNVYNNSEGQMEIITKELNILERTDELWEVKSVREIFNNSRKELDAHWKKHHKWLLWRCPESQFHWFKKPIPLNPQNITGKQKVISMHGSYQAISPEIALEILIKNLPKNHKCINWLVEGEFDENLLKEIPTNKKSSSQKLRKKYKGKYANSTSNSIFEYWVEGKRTVNPHHSILQAKFVSYLKKNKVIPVEDKDFIDVQYEENGVLYFSELKPTDNIKTKYAIRSAIGQILEYSYKSNKKAKLEIVVGSKPKKEEIEFVKSLDISITYWNGKSFIKNRV